MLLSLLCLRWWCRGHCRQCCDEHDAQARRRRTNMREFGTARHALRDIETQTTDSKPASTQERLAERRLVTHILFQMWLFERLDSSLPIYAFFVLCRACRSAGSLKAVPCCVWLLAPTTFPCSISDSFPYIRSVVIPPCVATTNINRGTWKAQLTSQQSQKH